MKLRIKRTSIKKTGTKEKENSLEIEFDSERNEKNDSRKIVTKGLQDLNSSRIKILIHFIQICWSIFSMTRGLLNSN